MSNILDALKPTTGYDKFRMYGKQNLITIVSLPCTKVYLVPSLNTNQPTKKDDVTDVHQFILIVFDMYSDISSTQLTYAATPGCGR